MTRPESVRSVVIVGGGVGGLSLAIALHRAGVEPVVLERRQDAASIERGGGFILWNNAIKALQEIGLVDRLLPLATVLEKVEWRTPAGHSLANWGISRINEAVGVPAAGIMREHLQTVLVDAVPDGALRLGTVCVGVQQDAGGVTVRLADGQALRADVVVGADGINSALRASLHGGWTHPRFAGVSQSFGVTSRPVDSADQGLFLEVDGRGLRFFAFPVCPGRTYWAAATRVPYRASPPLGPAEEKERLLSRFGRWADPVPALLEATDAEAIYRRDIVDRDPIRRWGDGRVTLLGDAAHPITPNLGQGACQAIEDAVVLARYLRDGGDVVTALRSYEAARFRRTNSFVRRSRIIGSVGRWENPLACWGREQLTKVLVNGPALRRHAQDMAYEF